MSNRIPSNPPSPYPRCSSPKEQSFQVLSFAITLIVALGLIITGVLGIYKIEFFAGIGTHISKGLAIGGGALAGVAISAYITCVCVCRKSPVITDESARSLDQAAVQQVEEPQLQPPKKRYVIKTSPNNPKNPEQPLPAPEVIATPSATTLEKAIDPALDPNSQVTTAEAKPSFSLPPEKPASQPFLTWQPLVALQEKHKIDIYAPSTEFVILNEARTMLPLPQEILGSPMYAKSHFVKKMQEIYQGLRKGELKIVSNCREVILKGNGCPPIHMIAEAQEFITKHLEAFNELINQRKATQLVIDTVAFFEAFSAEDRKLMPDWRLASHKNVFIRNLGLELKSLFQTEASRLALCHFDQIEAYMKHEVSKFNTAMHEFMQKSENSSLDFEDVKCEALDPIFKPIKCLFTLWERMERICSFEGAVDAKIDALESLCTDLPEPNSALWIDFPIFKTLIVTAFNSLSLGFFANYTFWMNNPQDMQRKDRLQTIIDAIAINLGVDSLKIEIDTKDISQNDASLALSLQEEETKRQRAQMDELSRQAIQQLLATGQFR